MACRKPPKPTITLPGIGKVIGKQQNTRIGVPINVFRAIPYAKPPIGKLRFGLPQPLNHTSQTILDCTKGDSTPCIQPDALFPDCNMLIRGSEDCLYLNIYTPSFPQEDNGNANSMANLAVLVWFHGGAFCIGSNEMSFYGPDYLLDYGIVLVAVNYRLGPLGFLNLECEEAPG